MKVRQWAFRQAGRYVTVDLGSVGALEARASSIGGWETVPVYLLDGRWDVGARVILGSDRPDCFVGVRAGIPPRSVRAPWTNKTSTMPGQPATLVADAETAAVFHVEHGESAGTWALRYQGEPVTVERDRDGWPLTVRLERTPVQSWQSFEVVDVATGRVVADPS